MPHERNDLPPAHAKVAHVTKRSVTHVSLSSAKIAVASEAVNGEQLVASVAAGREEVDVADR